MPPRSIAIVLHDFSLGGTERIAVRLGRAWSERGVAVRIFCGNGEGPLRAMAGERAEIVVADPPIPRGPGSVARLAAATVAYLRRRPVEGLFVPGNFHWPVARALAALPKGERPIVVVQISAALRKPQRRVLGRILFDLRMRRLLRGADGLVALSQAAAGQAVRIVPGATIRAIPTPALEDDVAPPVAASGGMVMAAGRLVPEKGFATLIAAFARADITASTLAIVGAGPDEARLRSLAATAGLGDRLVLPGYAPDIRPWLDRARLFVLSSEFEGYPAVLVEALAAGRPVIATDCTPATGELLATPDRGMVVPVGDVAAMSNAIGAMLDRPPPDPAPLAASVVHHRLGGAAGAYLDFFADLAAARA